MEKWMCLATIGVSGLLLLVFALDLALKFPFGGLSPLVDILSIIAGGLVAYLGWESFREVR
jgi:hypothetical protein